MSETSIRTPVGSETGERYPVALLLSLMLATFMGLLDVSVATTALPSIQQSMHSDFAGMQWVLDGYTVSLAAVMLSAGALADRIGRKRTFLGGVSVFTVASLACACSPNLAVLLTARIAQGAAASTIVPGALSLVTQSFPDPRRRTGALGLLSGVTSVSLVAGPLVGGPLTDAFGWPSIFLINVPLGLIAVLLGLRTLRESKNPERASFDLSGQVLAVVWVGALTYGAVAAGAGGLTSPRAWISFAVATAGFVAFVVIESRHPTPMLPIRMFTQPRFAAVNLGSFAIGFGGYTLFLLFTLYLQGTRGFSATEAAVHLLPHVLSNSVGALLAGRLAARLGSPPVMCCGYVLLIVGCLGVVLFTAHTPYWLLATVFIITGLGVGISITPTNVAGLSAVPTQRSGTASGIISTTRQSGSALGIAVLGAIVDSAASYTNGMHTAVLVGTIPLVLGTLMVLATPRRQPAAGAA